MMISEHLITMTDSDNPASEAYRTLRTNLMMREFDKEMQVINVISAAASEGKSTTVLNLAVVYAQLNKKVLVIDLDLRLPSIHKKLKIRNRSGITDVLTQHVVFDEAVIHYADNLDVLTSGTKIPFASEFIQSASLKTFIAKMREKYDVILLDCPPINLVTDGIIVSSVADGTLLVIAHNQDERKDLLRAKDLLDQMNTNIVGIVMTRMPVSKKYYDYSYRYSDRKPEKKDKGMKKFLKKSA